jgi:hypothetical protein
VLLREVPWWNRSERRMAPEHDETAEALNETEVRFSIRSLLIVTAGVAAATAAIAAFIRRFPADERLRLAAYWGVATAILASLVIYQARRRYLAESKAGQVHFLLHRHSFFFPRVPWLATGLFGAFSLLVALFAGAITTIGLADSHAWFHLDGTIFAWIFAATGIAAMWWRRVRLAEHGVVVRNEFARWEECRWYWDTCNKDVLVIDASKKPGLGSVALKIPAGKREAIVALLAAKCRQGSFL